MTDETGRRAHDYELGHSDRELKRLRLQAKLVDPFTREFFRDAGLVAGMRVLEIGSGAGDTTLVVAKLIGDEGEIVGIDKSPLAVAAAQERIDALGMRNVSFRRADPETYDSDRKFDAVVGRYVLMFNADPVRILRALKRYLRPGGVVAFHEVDWKGSRSNPAAPLYERCCDWIVRAFNTIGTNPHMGQDLHAAFVRAGLPAPTMSLRAAIGAPAAEESYVDMLAELAITMAPVMEEQGVIARGEIDPATLRRRMREEVKRLDSLVVGRSEIGAWSRTP